MEGMVAKWKGVTSQTKSKAKRSKGDLLNSDAEHKEEENKDGFVRMKAQEIVDVLTGKDSDPPTRTSHSAAKFTKVCDILYEIAGLRLKSESDRPSKDLDRPSKDLSPQIKPAAYQTQIIADLEAKFIDIKEERDALKREKDLLSMRNEQLQREVNLLMISQDLVDTLKRSQATLEVANKALLGELEEERRRLKEQQMIWEVEAEHLREALEQLSTS